MVWLLFLIALVFICFGVYLGRRGNRISHRRAAFGRTRDNEVYPIDYSSNSYHGTRHDGEMCTSHPAEGDHRADATPEPFIDSGSSDSIGDGGGGGFDGGGGDGGSD